MKREVELLALFESDNQVVFSYDTASDKITYMSPGCVQLLGYDPKDFYENSSLIAHVVHPDFIGEFNESHYKSPLQTTSLYSLQMLHANGTTRWVNIRIHVVLDLNENISKVDGFIRDISDIKKTETDLEIKIKELNFYVYSITHDLRGPIASTQGLISIAKKVATEEPLATYIDKIEESNQKIDGILLNLVEVIRTLKVTTIQKEALQMNEIIADILKSTEHNPKRKDIDIQTEINGNQIYYSDRKLIHSIIFNLIQNAILYHDKTENAWIKIIINQSNDALKISVIDNGAGIKEEIAPKVFEMFYRGNENSKGSGLGLFIVKNTVEKLSGNIEMISIEGEGTTFHITLPVN